MTKNTNKINWRERSSELVLLVQIQKQVFLPVCAQQIVFAYFVQIVEQPHHKNSLPMIRLISKNNSNIWQILKKFNQPKKHVSGVLSFRTAGIPTSIWPLRQNATIDGNNAFPYKI